MSEHDGSALTGTAGSEEQLAAELRCTQLLHDVATRLVSEENVQVIYDELMAAAISLTNAAAGTVQILDENTEELVLLASRGITPAMAEHFNRVDARSDTSCGALATGQRTYVNFDEPACSAAAETSFRMHVENGLLSAQSTPLVTRLGKPIGMVSTHWRSHHTLTERELRFLDLLARQFADLIELRQAQDAVKESEARLAADLAGMRRLYELHAKIGTEPDLKVALDEILAAACEFTHTDRGCIQLVSEDGKRLEMFTWRGYDGETSPFLTFFRYEGFKQGCDVARVERRRLIIEDTRHFPGLEGTEAGAVALAEDILAAQSSPMVSRTNETVGVLSTQFRHPHCPTEEELRLVDLVAWTGANFVERHRAVQGLRESDEESRRLNEELEERVRERTRELAEANVSLQSEVTERRLGEQRIKNLLRQVVNAQEEERGRIARELHDTLGQQLAALHMNIEILKTKADGDSSVHEDIARMQKNFDSLNSTVEFLAWELRPASLDLLGLDAALQAYVRDWSQQFGIQANYHVAGMEGTRLAPEVETNLYRIFQEALQNVHKHAHADRVNVLLERRDGTAVLIVEDNGKGYDEELEASAERGMGVTNMKERAALVGGSLEIEFEPGNGTTLFVRVPVSDDVIMGAE